MKTDHPAHSPNPQMPTTEAAIAAAEGRYAKAEAGHHESPDMLYDRQRAQELMRLVMQRVRARYEAKGKAALFDALRPVLLTGGSLIDHDSTELASTLKLRPGARPVLEKIV